MRLLLLLSLALFFNTSFGQEQPENVNPVTVEDLKMRRYEKDSTADAIILFERGETIIEPYRGTKHTVFRRVKFFNKNMVDEWGIVKVFAYRSRISKLSGRTYNLVNNEIVKEELNQDFAFKNQFTKTIDELSVALPNIQEGTIIEYSYTIMEDEFLNPRSWAFQHNIPTKWSEYAMLYTLQDGFNIDIRGAHPIDRYYKNSYGKHHTWIMLDVQAFKPEHLMPHEDLYKSVINFWPKKRTWLSVYNYLASNVSFGDIIRSHGYLNKTVKSITENLTDPSDKVRAISTYIKEHVEWNGIYDFMASDPKDVLQKGRGTSGDINLLLASMIEKAGIPVNLALLSTRGNGAIIEDFPSTSQFNYVICVVPVGDKFILMDATDKFLSYNVLPEYCENLSAFLLAGGKYYWIKLPPTGQNKVVVNASLEVTDEPELKGEVIISKGGYIGYKARKNQQEHGNEQYLSNQWKGRLVTIDTSSTENNEVSEKPLLEKYTMTIHDCISEAGKTLYIKPFILQNEMDFFKNEKRIYPIDFGTSKDELMICTITIPEAYSIQHLPESKSIMLPDNSARFVVNFAVLGNKIQITSSLVVKKTEFTAPEYLALRELYSIVNSKSLESIVLERK
jgi:hypothetical protein